LRKALWREEGKILGTVEFFPQEGKYHYDGHRKCGVCLGPAEAAAAEGICPVCGKALTRGVMSRVLELADREVDETAACPSDTEAANRRPYHSLIPLNEILGELLGTGTGSKKVEAAYGNLIKKGGSEFSLLMEKDLACIEGLRIPGLSGELLAEAIGRMRSGKVLVDPGYDGEYGSIKVFGGKVPAFMGESLFEELPEERKRGAEKTPGIPKTAAKKKDGPKGSAPAPRQDGTFSFVPDQAQQEAVSFNGKWALIIAGPGTGKTAVLSARIVRRIEKEGADPASILAVSFTIKAAAELKERILRFSDPSGSADPAAVTAATFHSFCCSVLREEYAAAGLRQDFKILGEEERDALLADICSRGKNLRGRKKTPPRRLGDYIEERKRFLLLPGETSSPFAAECPAPDPQIEELYGEYRLSIRTMGALDFEDLVAGAVRLLSVQERVLGSLRRRFRYIFVDEYQDINLAQYALIRRLAPGDDESPSLWVIGDPDQAIYGFRGSDKRFIDRFLEDYPEACRFELTRSFRCAEPIIRAAGQLTGKHLKGVSLEAPDSELKLFRTGYPSAASEAEGIARSIAGLVGGTSFFAIDSDAAGQGEQGLSPGDCAVLVRIAALAEGIAKALNDHGIPFELTGQSVWWEEEPVKTLINALRENLFRSKPGRAAPPGDEIKAAWASLFPARRFEDAEGVKELLRIAEISGDLPSLLDGLACSSAEGMTGIRRQGVKVMTIHASKGLEFDQVFLPGLEEGVLPFTLYGNKDIDEERRLLYVAMTRARRGLWLSWAQSRTLGNRKCSDPPSRFLSELENIPLAPNGRPLKRDPQLKLF
jgi:superfamily I DNA/RNA helicase